MLAEPIRLMRQPGTALIAPRPVNWQNAWPASATKLQLAWSPEQIAGWLKRTYPDDGNFQVSHETIYRSLFHPGPYCF